MCGVNKLDNLEWWGGGIAIGAAIAGISLIGAGNICGSIIGWQTLAISLLTTGGGVFVLGVVGGFTVMFRAGHLQQKLNGLKWLTAQKVNAMTDDKL